MIYAKDAQSTANALAEAAGTCPVRQVRNFVQALSDEYATAAESARLDDGVVIELAGSVTKGDIVDTGGRDGFCRVIRRTAGGTSLHCSSPNSPAGTYINMLDPELSPLVVKR